MGKGGRSHSRRYRIVVHSAEYYKKQREIKHRQAQAKELRDGNIFTGVMKTELELTEKGELILKVKPE